MHLSFEEIIKELPDYGYWKLSNCDPSCSLGLYYVTWEAIIKETHVKHNAFGNTPTEAVKNLIERIPLDVY